LYRQRAQLYTHWIEYGSAVYYYFKFLILNKNRNSLTGAPLNRKEILHFRHDQEFNCMNFFGPNSIDHIQGQHKFTITQQVVPLRTTVRKDTGHQY